MGAFQPTSEPNQFRCKSAPTTSQPDERADSTEQSLSCHLVNGLLALRPCPTLLLNADGHVVGANTLAEQTLRKSADWLHVANGVIRCRNSRLLTLLEQMVAADAESRTRRACMITWADETQTMTVVSRLTQQAGMNPGNCSPECNECLNDLFVAVLFEHEVQNPADQQGVLVDAFGLTPTESRLALALLDRQSLNDFAEASRLKISTVRWHLRNILEKTQCANQIDLIRLLASIRFM